MTFAITKRHLKKLIRQGHWAELGKLFKFKPVYMKTVTNKAIIDWRCVPRSMSDILTNGDLTEKFLIEVAEEPTKIFASQEEVKTKTKQSVAIVRKLGRTDLSEKVPNRTRRQCEFIGDHIIGMAAAELAFEHCKGPPSYPYSLYHDLVSNKNMGGNAVETEIGEIYYVQGYDKALEFSKEIILKSGIWKKFVLVP